MYLQSIASWFPEFPMPQRDGWELFRHSSAAKRLQPRSMTLVEKILTGDTGIDQRHFAISDIERIFDLDPGELNREFEVGAPDMACRAAHIALDRARLQASEVDALFVCTCTGYLCPGVSSHVAEALGIRSDAELQDLVGLGCGAAIPMLRAASHYLAVHPGHRVLTIAVEMCSAAFFVDDDPGALVSLCLFGDGASASVWSGETADWQAHHFQSLHWPQEREKIRFVNEGGRLKNQLHRTVPALAADAVQTLYQRDKMEDNGARVLSHTGGRDVLEAIEKKMGIPPLEESRRILRKAGNVSSPSVLMALEDYLSKASGNGDAKTLGLTGFGAGFSAHSCQFQKNADQ
ncbi:MAG: 3-oxoacyl-[acyl-carrier-protein] synthase III C-terminal domain-containing protein [Verrucomicrobiota bacterium]